MGRRSVRLSAIRQSPLPRHLCLPDRHQEVAAVDCLGDNAYNLGPIPAAPKVRPAAWQELRRGELDLRAKNGRPVVHVEVHPLDV